MKEKAQLLEAYFRRLLEIRQSGAGVKEESYYDALSNLLNGMGNLLKPRVRCILQLANRGAGRPDGGLFTEDQTKLADMQKPLTGQIPARGVIEVKPTSDDAWVTVDTRQVTDYWEHYRQVLVTNYRDFVLVGQDQDGSPLKVETYRLADSEDHFWIKVAHPRAFADHHETSFTEFLHRVMLHAAPLAAPKDVAWFLASFIYSPRFPDFISSTIKVNSVAVNSTYVITLRSVMLHSPEDTPPISNKYETPENVQGVANIIQKIHFLPVLLKV